MNIDEIARECTEKITKWLSISKETGETEHSKTLVINGLIKTALQQVADDAARQMREDCMNVCSNSKDAYKKRQIDATPKGHMPDLVLCGLYIQLAQTMNQLSLPSKRSE